MVQGTAAAITKLACIYFFDYLQKNDLLYKVLIPNVVHDELIAESPESISEDLSLVIKECMEKAGNRFFTRVPLKADPYVGKDWTH